MGPYHILQRLAEETANFGPETLARGLGPSALLREMSRNEKNGRHTEGAVYTTCARSQRNANRIARLRFRKARSSAYSGLVASLLLSNVETEKKWSISRLSK
jgi:hypothetical protein